MIGVHSDAMKAVAGHHAFGAQRVRGWLVESVDGVPSIIALVYQDNGDVCAEVVWMDHTHAADLDLIVAYLNERAGGESTWLVPFATSTAVRGQLMLVRSWVLRAALSTE